MASYIGCRKAVATVNGTAALHVALRVAGVQADDEVLVSDLTFIAPVNAVRYLGAWPVLIDTEPDYWQMDPQKVLDFLERRCVWANGRLRNKTTGRRVIAVLPVHILGHPVDMDLILDVAHKYELKVVEDATESLGAKYKGRMVGHLGDIACFSFNGNKIITTGGGGMILTNNEAWAAKAKYLTTQAKDDPLEFVHGEVGYNYRLPNILAAIGCAQLENLAAFVARKREIAAAYTATFADLAGVEPMREPSGSFSTFWLYTIRIDESRTRLGSRDLMKALDAERIQTRPLWQPMHLSPAHRGAFTTDCSTAERLNRECLSLPCSVGLTKEDRVRVSEILRRTLRDAT